MKRAIDNIIRPVVLLTLSCAAASACTPSDEPAELGVYARQGAPEDDAAAVATEADAGGADADAGGADAGGADAGGAVVSVAPPCLDTGCVSDTPVVYDDPNLVCFSLTAHAPSDISAPYPVPVADQYVKFTTRLPAAGERYIRSIKPIIGNARVLHDMKLFSHHGALAEGVAANAPTPDALRLVYSWEPVARGIFLDETMAIAVEADSSFTLEAHYNLVGELNSQGSMSDASGFELCHTSTPPAYTVSISRLGSVDIAGRSATGTCTPQNREPVQLLALQPRMNTHGAGAKLAINRKAGGQELVYDEPFAFSQGGLHTLSPTRVDPGDTLTTSCSYTMSSNYGPSIEDELCELYVLQWPAHSLISVDDAQPDSCLQ